MEVPDKQLCNDCTTSPNAAAFDLECRISQYIS